MNKLRAALLSFVLCTLLCSPAIIMALTGPLSIDLPSWLTAKDSTYLAGGVSKANLKKNVSVRGFMDKKLQSSIETAVGNHIPVKAFCLLGTSALQRSFISASAAFMGEDTYPAFFGADRVYSKKNQALSTFPLREQKNSEEKIERLAEKLNAAAERYPQVQFVVYVADSAYSSEANVARGLVSYKQFTTAQTTEIVEGSLTAPNIIALSNPSTDTEEYYSNYYRSDHHWTMRGAMNAYNNICGHLDFPLIDNPSFKDIDGPEFYGSGARAGLMRLADKPIDIDFDFASVEYKDGKEWYSGNDHHGYFDAPFLDKEYKFYNLYWKRKGNLTGPGTTNALLISDSFGDCLRRPLALNHAKLTPKLNLHENEKSDDTLAEYLEKSGADTVYFVGGVGNYLSFEKRNPHFFDD